MNQLERLRKLVEDCQNDLAKWIVPDSGISDHDVLNTLLGRLDGPQSREALATPYAVQDGEVAELVSRLRWQQRYTYGVVTVAQDDAANLLERQSAELLEARKDAENLRALLTRYRKETPLGHQPHMIAHLVDAALTGEPK